MSRQTNAACIQNISMLNAFAGRVMSQAICCRPFNAEAQVRIQTSPCGIFGGRSVTETNVPRAQCASVGIFPAGTHTQSPMTKYNITNLQCQYIPLLFLRADGSYTYHRAVKGGTLSPCCTLNTDPLNCTSQPANAVYRNSRCLLRES